MVMTRNFCDGTLAEGSLATVASVQRSEPRVAPCRCVGRADTHDLYLPIHFLSNWIYCEPSAEIEFSFELSGLTFT